MINFADNFLNLIKHWVLTLIKRKKSDILESLTDKSLTHIS